MTITHNITTLRSFLAAVLACALWQITSAQPEKTIFRSKAYNILENKVEQGKFTAEAASDTSLFSNYHSPDIDQYSPTICFKFSINLRDNEMNFGKNHWVTLQPQSGKCVTTVLFGKPSVDTVAVARETNLAPGTQWTVRLDMRNVLKAFKEKGYYTLFNGEKLYKADFKGVYIAGGTRPLSWDFNNLGNQPSYQLHDPEGNGIYTTTLIMNTPADEKRTCAQWLLSRNLSACPRYKSEYPLTDALYNLALEEMIKAVEPDSTFRTGKEWGGVWTRDISYSIILSMASLQPQVARYSLLRKVKNGRIIQDTGTGGAYPVSTDRMIWSVAAWELYKTTGDRAWLQQAYAIIRNSENDDRHNAYDPATGLVHGESTFLDWREQTYPTWMQPADIYAGEDLGTNAVHYEANIVLSGMAEELHDYKAAALYRQQAQRIKAGINTWLWMKDKGYYGQYRYGRNYPVLSPRSEALGEALCVLFGIADPQQQKSVIENTPVTTFGISCIYPQIPGIPSYHNNAVWPFVESYWALASAKAGNEKSVLEAMASVYRPAALFLTNKENFVASNGDFAGTQINSDNMLWSLSGSLSLIYKVIFGMEFQKDKLIFHPFVPETLQGNRSLTHFKYRKALLTIDMQGYGNSIRSFELDGKTTKPFVPCTLTGLHTIKIVLANNTFPDYKIHKVVDYTSPETPAVTLAGKKLLWKSVQGAVSYLVLKNGHAVMHTINLSYPVQGNHYAEFQVIAVDKNGVESFASEPLAVNTSWDAQTLEMEKYAPKAGYPYKNYSGSGFVEISKTQNRSITIPVNIRMPGIYAIRFRYANGNGPINTDNKCALRTLRIDHQQAGTIVFPQRGTNEWSNWGYSNTVQVSLTKGQHQIVLSFEPSDENMNGAINQAMLDCMVINRIK
ncbi:MGH1-like glycoside hydrolase domain-containing protein [Microbacter margulisiae]|uniref:CBM6 domain-containing protein n=1 Tax=Microbacter margulisiae TaxID=1350067 RepID=A0A7W5DSA1_9PORP|nr:glycogen debranching protein [Microbacter margulisiae]MBB3188142.1 hypothetical protein [Microbacter margulisiae]